MRLHQPLTLALVGVAATLVACGSSNSTTSSTSSDSSSSSSGGAASDAKSLTVTEADLSAVSLKQASDGPLGTAPNSVQRVFVSSDSSLKFEVDVVVDSSADKAASDYSQFDASAKAQVPNVSATTHPNGSNQAVLYTGDDGAGGTRYAEVFQRGAYIVVVLGRGAQGGDASAFGNAFSQVVAKQDGKIPAS